MNQIQSDLSEVWLEHYKLPYKNLSDSGIKSILEKVEILFLASLWFYGK